MTTNLFNNRKIDDRPSIKRRPVIKVTEPRFNEFCRVDGHPPALLTSTGRPTYYHLPRRNDKPQFHQEPLIAFSAYNWAMSAKGRVVIPIC